MGKSSSPADKGPKKKRTGGRSARVTTAVLDAALKLVRTRGLSGFSISDLAAQSGVHETTIYRRWGSVERLILEILLERADSAIPERNTGSFRRDMVAMIRDAIEFCRSPTGTSLLRALAVVGEEAAPLKQQYWQARMSVAERVVERAKARGELDKGVSSELLIQALVGPLYLRILVSGQPIEPDFPELMVETVLRTVKSGPKKP